MSTARRVVLRRGGDWDSYLIWQGDSTTSGRGFGQLRLIAR